MTIEKIIAKNPQKLVTLILVDTCAKYCFIYMNALTLRDLWKKKIKRPLKYVSQDHATSKQHRENLNPDTSLCY